MRYKIDWSKTRTDRWGHILASVSHVEYANTQWLRKQFWYSARVAELNLTKYSIKRIADEARGRFMLFGTVHEFFKAYHLNDLEKEYFWRCYKYPESC